MFGIEITYCLFSVETEQNLSVYLLCLQNMSLAMWTWDGHKRKFSF